MPAGRISIRERAPRPLAGTEGPKGGDLHGARCCVVVSAGPSPGV